LVVSKLFANQTAKEIDLEKISVTNFKAIITIFKYFDLAITHYLKKPY